jgi:serine kinase of HPr protein (carbohydrate metabolism regulator)
MVTVHGTCIAFDGKGILLRGPPGCGKSDLALRAFAAGASLVADDRVSLSARGGTVLAFAPPALFGMIEVRGIGIVRMEAESESPVALVVDLERPDRIERMPEPCRCELIGIPLPRIVLAPFESSAVAKLRIALNVTSGTELLLQ